MPSWVGNRSRLVTTAVLLLQLWNYKTRRCIFTLLSHLDYIRTTFFHQVGCPDTNLDLASLATTSSFLSHPCP